MCLIQDLPSGECHLLCPLVAGDLTRLYPPSGSHGHLSKKAILQSSGLKQVTPTPLQVAHGGSLPPGPREFPPINSSLHHSLTEPHMGYSLPFPFSPPALQSPHIVSGLYSMSFMNSAGDKNAMIILSELGDTHSQVCWAAGCKEVQGSGG